MPNIFETFRNPYASVFQHALHRAITARQPKAFADLSGAQPEMKQFVTSLKALEQGESPMQAAALAGVPVADCSQLAAQLIWAETNGEEDRARRLKNEIEKGACDAEWITAVAAYWAWRASKQEIPYVRYEKLSDFVLPLPDKAEIVIGVIGDWGTGLDDARWLLAEVVKKSPDVLIHLGDIYYAGMPDEVRNNFLAILNFAAPNIPVFTLSGNHDMYSGGAGYYWLLTQLNAAASLRPYRQAASYFCLRNAYWQILAMDTGLHDVDPRTVNTNVTFLDEEEAVWHLDKLETAGDRQTILMSHHQLFTAFGDGVGKGKKKKTIAFNPKLLALFRPFFGNIALWLWGHEHNFEVFQPYVGLKRGRCVGASAIPVLEKQQPYALISKPDLQGQKALPQLDPAVPPLALNSDRVYFHNYAMVTLRVPGAGALKSRIDYYEVDSSNHGESELMFGEVIS